MVLYRCAVVAPSPPPFSFGLHSKEIRILCSLWSAWKCAPARTQLTFFLSQILPICLSPVSFCRNLSSRKHDAWFFPNLAPPILCFFELISRLNKNLPLMFHTVIHASPLFFSLFSPLLFILDLISKLFILRHSPPMSQKSHNFKWTNRDCPVAS